MILRNIQGRDLSLPIFEFSSEKIKGVAFDSLVNLHNENPFLKPISLALADYPDLFWHSTMVATGIVAYFKD